MHTTDIARSGPQRHGLRHEEYGVGPADPAHPTSRGQACFERHIPKNSCSGISDHLPVNVLCQHQPSDHRSREDASLLHPRETMPSPFQGHVQGQESCQVGVGGGGQGRTGADFKWKRFGKDTETNLELWMAKCHVFFQIWILVE